MIDAIAENSGTAQPNQQPNPIRHVHVQERRQAGVFEPTRAVASGRPSATEESDGKRGRRAITASRLSFVPSDNWPELVQNRTTTHTSQSVVLFLIQLAEQVELFVKRHTNTLWFTVKQLIKIRDCLS